MLNSSKTGLFLLDNFETDFNLPKHSKNTLPITENFVTTGTAQNVIQIPITRSRINVRFDSSRIRWIKKPKVHVTYNIFDFGGKEHSDWVDADNCTFSIIKKQ